MSLERLRRLAENFESVAPADYSELADSCRDLAIHRLDVRYMVLGESLRLSSSAWGGGEGGGVGGRFYDELARIWRSFLPGILRTKSEEEGVALALALLEELRILGTVDPLSGP